MANKLFEADEFYDIISIFGRLLGGYVDRHAARAARQLEWPLLIRVTLCIRRSALIICGRGVDM